MSNSPKYATDEWVYWSGCRLRVGQSRLVPETGTHRYILIQSNGRGTGWLDESELSKTSLSTQLEEVAARVTRLEATVASLNGIDEPTIDRCTASIHVALDELIDALQTTADITGTTEAMSRANAARLAKSRVRELEAFLGPVTRQPGAALPLEVGDKVFVRAPGRYIGDGVVHQVGQTNATVRCRDTSQQDATGWFPLHQLTRIDDSDELVPHGQG